MNKRLLVSLFSLAVIATGTVIAIRYAEGYRPTMKGQVRPTGLLNANSFPTGASVYINGNLTSATDATINLDPGSYTIEIKKEGYTNWKKTMTLEKELVTQTNALLFPNAPSLSALSFVGATNVVPSPDGQKLLFTTASASASRNNGVYVLDLTDNPLALQKGPRQIARSTSAWTLEKASYLWSPNSDQVLITLGTHHLLVDPNRFSDLDTVQDVTVSLDETLATWKDQLETRMQSALLRFPVEITRLATQSATHLYISPDQDRLMYTATASATIPEHLIPPVPAADSQVEQRTIQPENTYVYDRKEDKNFLVLEAAPSPTASPAPVIKGGKHLVTPQAAPAPSLLSQVTGELETAYSGLSVGAPQWLPDSSHVILATDTSIDIVEYDGTNRTQVYAGPFAHQFVYPWPNGSKLIILTNLNQSGTVPENLYAIGIK